MTKAPLVTVLLALSLLGGLARPATASDWLPDNTRAAIDLSSRYTAVSGENVALSVVGLDVHSVISGSKGDIGTLILQPYLIHLDPGPPSSSPLDNPRVQWRISNFNYTGLGHGRFNIRVGHFEVPFGLEQVIETNGTLNQMNSPSALGLKADWGVSVNGTLPWLEYEFAQMQGSRDRFSTAGDGYLAGRVGLPRTGYFWLGASFLRGDTGIDDATPVSERYGVDLGWRLPLGWTFLAENIRGETDGRRVSRWLTELNYSTPMESGLFYLQLRRDDDWGTASRRDHRLQLGGRFVVARDFTLSFEYGQAFDSGAADDTATFQFRYRL